MTVRLPVPLVSAAAILAATAMLTAGCASLGRPDWLDPGPAKSQQRRAVRFDPFPASDVGSSSFRQYGGILDGTRPRDYTEPMPEVKRARWWAPAQ